MKNKLLTVTISVLCVLTMMAMVFQPAAAARGSEGMIIQQDTLIDENGNTHMVYSQLIKNDISTQAEVFYKNDIGSQIPGHAWNSPVQISYSELNSHWPQVSIDETTGIIYVSWIEEAWHDNKYWYAGSSDHGISFTSPRYGGAAPWPVAPNLDMVAGEGIVSFSWVRSGSLALTADIDCDLIPDISDAEPMIYNTDNFAIDMTPDVIATDNDLGVTVAVDYSGEDNIVPTVESTSGNFSVSTGEYIDINVDTSTEFKAIIKMPITENVPATLTSECLRMYRQVGDNWVVVTDWENGEYTGINQDDGYVWAYVEHFSVYTQADASQSDSDGDGLTDLSEDTQPVTNAVTELTKTAFNPITGISTNPSTITTLSFTVSSFNNYLIQNAVIELTPASGTTLPINDLQLDVGNDGTIDWRAIMPFTATLRLGSIRGAMNEYIFKYYTNSAATTISIPFKFTSSNGGQININYAKIIVDDVTTANYLSDTSQDGLYDGWQDKDKDMIFERAGQDGILGTSDDEIPGERSSNYDPRIKNIVGSKGKVAWNEYQDGINQVNGNLAVTSLDIELKALGHTIKLERIYNSLNSEINGPFGYGWQFNYGEKLQFRTGFVDFIAGDGSFYEFESLGNGAYSSPPGVNIDIISAGTFYNLRFTDGSVKVFSSQGLLNEIVDKNGNSLHMSYDGNYRLIKVEDDSGLYLNLIYTGNLITSVVDPAGRTNTYTYDINGNLRTRKDAMNNEYRYSYNILTPATIHKMVMTINPLGLYKEYQYTSTSDWCSKISKCTVGEYYFDSGQKTQYYVEYEATYVYPGHTTTTLNANTQSTKRIFDSNGAAVKIINPDTTSTSITFNKDLKPELETDARGFSWKSKYDAVGNLIEREDPLTKKTGTVYSTFATPNLYLSIPIKTVDKNGEETNYVYDANNNPLSLTNSEGYTSSYVFSSNGLMTSQTSANGGISTYTYDAHGNIVEQTDALGYHTFFSYNTINQKVSMTDARGFVTQYTYDALGRMTQTIDSLNNIESYTYDAMGNLLSFTDRNAAVTTYTYDVFGNKLTERDALLKTKSFEYVKGHLIKETDKRGAITNYEYDAMDRVVKITDALGFFDIYTYDASGNMIKKQDKLGNFWANTYDALGRIIEEYCPYNLAIRYQYDAEGRMTKRIDRMNYETIYEYNSLGNRVRELGAAGSDTRYSYDSIGNLVSVSQYDGDLDSTWQYGYDLLGRKISETSPLGSTYSWAYDEVGNLIEYIDANDQNTSYTYDALNRVTKMGMPGDITVYITYQITQNERQGYNYPPNYEIYIYPPRPQMPTPPRLSVQNKEFDLLGRVTRETWVFVDEGVLSQQYIITYQYDENGNIISMTDQFGLITTYTYDALNRLKSVIAPGGGITTYVYDAIGQLVQTTYPTGTKIYQSYAKSNVLTKIENVKSNGQIISSFTYGYNYNANRISVKEANGATTNYAYDAENRLIGVSYPDGSKTQYQYDLRNNMIATIQISSGGSQTTTSVYDDENKLLQSGTTTYIYDNNGNMVEGDTYYGYQSTFLNGQKQNMLVSVGTVGGGGGGDEQNSVGEGPVTLNSAPSTSPSLVDTRATTYGYALDGRRVSKAGVVNLTYLYDGESVVYELWDNKLVRFTHPSASACGQKCGSGCGGGKLIFVDHPISISIDGVKYYYLYDGLGSVSELIDSGENVVNTYRYTPFGEALVRNELVYNPHQFTGRQYDAESGLYHYRARAYSPDIGRFMQQDPAGMVDGPNMYAYVGWNPVNRVDPTGLLSFAGLCALKWSMFFINMFFSAIGIAAKLSFIESLSYNLMTVWKWSTITAAIFSDIWAFAGIALSIFVWISIKWIQSLPWWQVIAKSAFMGLKFISWGTILPLIGILISGLYGAWRLRQAGCL